MTIRKPKSIEKSCYLYADIWSNKNELTPKQVFISSGKKYWFDCKICNHDYEQRPADKTNGIGCPICSGRILCGSLECNLCLPRSCYMYREIWSSRNSFRPEEVALYSNKNFWFDCKKCPHDYEQSPANKTSSNNGCPYCCNQKICGNLKCTFCLPKSCHIYKDIWNSRNKLRPEQGAISSHKKFWFNCLNCKHDYQQSPNCKTKGGQGCPTCINKTEKKFADYLHEYDIIFTFQFKTFSKKPYDFCLPEYKLIIEIDGEQHFQQVSNWNCPIKTRDNDIQKMKVALENGYSVLRIYQPDMLNERLDWRQEILDNMYIRSKPSVIYVSSIPNLYDRHKASNK